MATTIASTSEALITTSATATTAAAGDLTSTQQYLKAHSLDEILEGLLAELLYIKPADPKKHIVSTLEKTKVAGSKPLLNATDLATIFSMFDITKRGVVTEQQATSALRTVLGPGRAPQASSAAAETPLSQTEFVQYMSRVLCAATPLCKPGSSAIIDDADAN